MGLIITTLRRFVRGIASSIVQFGYTVFLILWDISLVLINAITCNRKVGKVTPKGHPGAGGVWPEYIPPQPGDSRSSCPALNAMANHGIIARDGRNISFREVSAKARTTFNFSPSLALFMTRALSQILDRSYLTGTFDLSDADVHDGIEHDASFTRPDSHLQPDQSMPEAQAAKGLADFDKNRTLTPRDFGRRLDARRRECRRDNGQYSIDFKHKLINSANASQLSHVFGGVVPDLYTFLTEERLPEGWEPRDRHQMGITIVALNVTALPIEFGLKEEVDKPLNLV
ncbi:Cloroperoxidase [Lactifluus volemus]|nr:Cloroperoxidase [Lactifluus volemus]